MPGVNAPVVAGCLGWWEMVESGLLTGNVSDMRNPFALVARFGRVRYLSLLALALTIAAALACSDSEQREADREAYVAANVAVFAALPVVTRSEQVEIRSEPYLDGPEGVVVGYQTTFALQLPAGWGIDDVFGFYEGALDPSWRAGREEASGGGPAPESTPLNGVAFFMVASGPRLIVAGPGGELVIVKEPTTISLDGTFEVVVDYGGSRSALPR